MKVSLLARFSSKRKRLEKLKHDVIAYFSSIPDESLDSERREIVQFLRRHPLRVFPYAFPDRYPQDQVPLEKDDGQDLYYTNWDGKKLFFRNGHKPAKAREYFNSLLIEQDEQSPHRYLTADFDVNEGDVVVDIGAAEGNFALSVIEKASRVYLFETEKKWVKALEATFYPWRHKVEIIQRYVSDRTTESTIALDDFFKGEQRVDFIKADVEGAEAAVVTGARDLIARQPRIKVALCTYHRQEDAEELERLMRGLGFQNHFSDGYMLYHYGKTNVVRAPYLRKAVLRSMKGD